MKFSISYNNCYCDAQQYLFIDNVLIFEQIRSNSLWDRDTKSVSTPNRTLSDSDALKKSFASSSISDKADDSDG